MPEYRGDELDAARGPGLGCFWFQVVLLATFIVLTPLTVKLGWPPIVSAVLLFVTIGLLLFVGQTVIFLLRIVAAERRGRRRPVASRTRTVGEIEDAATGAEVGANDGAAPPVDASTAAEAGGPEDAHRPAAATSPAAAPGAYPVAAAGPALAEDSAEAAATYSPARPALEAAASPADPPGTPAVPAASAGPPGTPAAPPATPGTPGAKAGSAEPPPAASPDPDDAVRQ